MAAKKVIAIFDVGKTNKKIFLFDEDYHIVYEKSDQFEEIRDEDGDSCEDLAKLTAWGKESFAELARMKDDIGAINFSAYGASFVHVDPQGRPVLPLYNYLKPLDPRLRQTFFDRYGGEEVLARVCASPVLDHLNSGFQLYRLLKQNRFPGNYHASLHLPQYLSSLITGRQYSDITSIGCHTMLWDFSANDYHRWVVEEGIAPRLAPLFPSNEVVHSRAHWRDYLAGIGLHDSSSALIPYLSSFNQPFILISTGTWCITLNPFNDTPLTDEQLRKDCLCYLSYEGRPVKASRLFAGYEHEQQTRRLAEHFQKAKNYFETVQFSSVTVAGLEAAEGEWSNGEISLKSSGFDRRDLGDYPTYEEAYHRLILDIIRQQEMSTKLVMEGQPVRRIFVDGGFGKNVVYMNLLARCFPEVEVFAASVPQATAIGAALAIHARWNTHEPPADLISLQFYSGQPTGKPGKITVKKR